MISLSEQKTTLRKASLARRDGLDGGDRIEMSLRACEHAYSIANFSPEKLVPGTVISGFLPIRSETDPRPLMFELGKRGARLCLPVVTSKTTIEFRELIRGAPLVESGFGTIGPDADANVLDPQILLVPLSVFDRQGGRIGYGAGFYDRAIKRLIDKDIQPVLLGMAFSVQESDRVPMEAHDRHLDGIITENGFHSVSP